MKKSELKELLNQALAQSAKLAGNLLEATFLVEQQRVQLAGVSVAAFGWGSPAKQGDYGWSVAYDDVRKLRTKYQPRTVWPLFFCCAILWRHNSRLCVCLALFTPTLCAKSLLSARRVYVTLTT